MNDTGEIQSTKKEKLKHKSSIGYTDKLSASQIKANHVSMIRLKVCTLGNACIKYKAALVASSQMHALIVTAPTWKRTLVLVLDLAVTCFSFSAF